MFINIREWHFAYEMIVGIFAFFANFLLIYLAIFKSGKHLRKYSLILIQACIIDIFFNITSMLFVPVVEMKDGNLFYMLGGYMEHLPRPYTCLFWMFFLESLLICVVNVAVQFIYRYFVLCRNIQLTVRQYLGIFSIAVLWVTLHCSAGFFVFYPTDEIINSHLHYLTIWRALYTIRDTMSRGTREAQKQITKILFIQALMPFVILSLPICVVVLTSMMGKSIPALGISLALTVSWMPIVNAISAILIVPSYRRFVLGFGHGNTIAEKTTAHQSVIVSTLQPQLSMA